MANEQIDALSKKLHPQAAKLVEEHTINFAISLLLQAKVLAYRRKDEIVLSNHIEEAITIITKGRKKARLREFVIVVGGALFGAFIQGFVAELSRGNTLLIAIYTSLGFIGIVLVFWGLWPQS